METILISKKDFDSLVNRAAGYEMNQDEIRRNYSRMVKIKDFYEYVDMVKQSISLLGRYSTVDLVPLQEEQEEY